MMDQAEQLRKRVSQQIQHSGSTRVIDQLLRKSCNSATEARKAGCHYRCRLWTGKCGNYVGDSSAIYDG